MEREVFFWAEWTGRDEPSSSFLFYFVLLPCCSAARIKKGGYVIQRIRLFHGQLKWLTGKVLSLSSWFYWLPSSSFTAAFVLATSQQAWRVSHLNHVEKSRPDIQHEQEDRNSHRTVKYSFRWCCKPRFYAKVYYNIHQNGQWPVGWFLLGTAISCHFSSFSCGAAAFINNSSW